MTRHVRRRNLSALRSGRPGRLFLLAYLGDRVLRLLAVWHFFRRRLPQPASWPSVTLLQPISCGASGLEDALRLRLALDYPAVVQHVMICDEADSLSVATCRAVLAEAPAALGELIVLPSTDRPVASKIVKLQAGLERATGDVLCFVDDDVRLRGATLRTLIPYLDQPGAGAAFGVACYVAWDTVWSSLMSLFVNANALLSYVPLSYLAQPWTITGHCFAVRRDNFMTAGGFDAMDGRIDDDHELARRLRRIGLRSVQTPLIYDVRNDLPSFSAYRAQIKRWFVFPRQAMLPTMTSRERAITAIGSLGNLLPPALGVLALVQRGRDNTSTFVASLAVFTACYRACEVLFLQKLTPLRRLPLLLLVALSSPIEVLLALVAGDEVEWRGQRLRVRRGGTFEVLG